MTDAVIDTLNTPDGPFTVLESDHGEVLASGWTADRGLILARVNITHRPTRVLPGNAVSSHAVEAYYEGEYRPMLAVPVAQWGTALFEAGWHSLRQIPAGSVQTYTEVARAMGRPKAIRVAASVCARNAPALFVPCHRVIRSDGALGGFAWGIDIKRALLAREESARS
jgi:methylated-DNA-[protein]-cysteine S-methyltransferase